MKETAMSQQPSERVERAAEETTETSTTEAEREPAEADLHSREWGEADS
jgi:hypothetical protein